MALTSKANRRWTADPGQKTVPAYSAYWPDLVAPELPVAEGTSFSTPFVSGTCALLAEVIQAKASTVDSVSLRLQKADQLFASGDYSGAAKLYSSALAEHPHLAKHAAGKISAGSCLRCQALIYPARMKLGLAYLQTGKPLDAVVAFGQNADIAPKFADAHMNLGAALREAGMLDEAIASFQRAIKLKPDKAEAYDGLADSFAKAGAMGMAIEAFGRSHSINPKRSYPLLRLAELHESSGNHATAEAFRALARPLD